MRPNCASNIQQDHSWYVSWRESTMETGRRYRGEVILWEPKPVKGSESTPPASSGQWTCRAQVLVSKVSLEDGKPCAATSKNVTFIDEKQWNYNLLLAGADSCCPPPTTLLTNAFSSSFHSCSFVCFTSMFGAIPLLSYSQ